MMAQYLLRFRGRAARMGLALCLLLAGFMGRAQAGVGTPVVMGNFPALADGVFVSSQGKDDCNGQRQVTGRFRDMINPTGGGEYHVWLRVVLWAGSESQGLGGFKIRKFDPATAKFIDISSNLQALLGNELNKQSPIKFVPVPASVPHGANWVYLDVKLNTVKDRLEANATYQLINTGNVFHVGVLRQNSSTFTPSVTTQFRWDGHDAQGYRFDNDNQGALPKEVLINLEEDDSKGRPGLKDLVGLHSGKVNLCRNDEVQFSAYLTGAGATGDWFTYEWQPSQGLSAAVDSCYVTYKDLTDDFELRVKRLGMCDLREDAKVQVKVVEPMRPVVITPIETPYCGERNVQFKVGGVNGAKKVTFELEREGEGTYGVKNEQTNPISTGEFVSGSFTLPYKDFRASGTPLHILGEPVKHSLRITAVNEGCAGKIRVPLEVQEAMAGYGAAPLIELIEGVPIPGDENGPKSYETTPTPPIPAARKISPSPVEEICGPVNLLARVKTVEVFSHSTPQPSGTISSGQASRFQFEWEVNGIRKTGSSQAKFENANNRKEAIDLPSTFTDPFKKVPVKLVMRNKQGECKSEYSTGSTGEYFRLKKKAVVKLDIKSNKPNQPQCLPVILRLDPTQSTGTTHRAWEIKLVDESTSPPTVSTLPPGPNNGLFKKYTPTTPPSDFADLDYYTYDSNSSVAMDGSPAAGYPHTAPEAGVVDLVVSKLKTDQHITVTLKAGNGALNVANSCSDQYTVRPDLLPTPFAELETPTITDATGKDPGSYITESVHISCPPNKATNSSSKLEEQEFCTPAGFGLKVGNSVEEVSSYEWSYQEALKVGNRSTWTWSQPTKLISKKQINPNDPIAFYHMFVNDGIVTKQIRVILTLYGTSGACSRQLVKEFGLRGKIKSIIKVDNPVQCPVDASGKQTYEVLETSEFAKNKTFPRAPWNLTWQVADASGPTTWHDVTLGTPSPVPAVPNFELLEEKGPVEDRKFTFKQKSTTAGPTQTRLRLKIGYEGCLATSNEVLIVTHPNVDPKIHLWHDVRDDAGKLADPPTTPVPPFAGIAWPQTTAPAYDALCAPVKIAFRGEGATDFKFSIKRDDQANFTRVFASEYVLGNQTKDTRTYTLRLEGSNASGCSQETQLMLPVYPEVNAKIEREIVNQCNPLHVRFKDVSQCFGATTNQRCSTRTWTWTPVPTFIQPNPAPTPPISSTNIPHQQWFEVKYDTPGTAKVHMTAISAAGCKHISDELEVPVPPTQSVDDVKVYEVVPGTPTPSNPTPPPTYNLVTAGPAANPKVVRLCSGDMLKAVANVQNCDGGVSFYFEVAKDLDVSGGTSLEKQYDKWGNGETGSAVSGSPNSYELEHTYVNSTPEPVEYRVIVQGRSTNGCLSTAKLVEGIKVLVYPQPVPFATFQRQPGCAPLNVKIGNAANADFGAGDNKRQFLKEWTFTPQAPKGPTDVVVGSMTNASPSVLGFRKESDVETVMLTNSLTDGTVVKYKVEYRPRVIWGVAPEDKTCTGEKKDLGVIEVAPEVKQVFKLKNPGDPGTIEGEWINPPIVPGKTQLCSGGKINVENLTTGGSSAAPLQHEWKFEGATGLDEATSGQQGLVDKVLTNTTGQDMALKLTVTTVQPGTGCRVVSEPMEIRVHPPVNADFNMSLVDACQYPAKVKFGLKERLYNTASSALGPQKTEYKYDFGYTHGGTPQERIQTNPSASDFGDFTQDFFNADPNQPQSYTVTLSAKQEYTPTKVTTSPSTFACADTKSKDITINPEVKVDFDVKINGVLGKTAACLPFDVILENKSSGSPDGNTRYIWEWGDNSSNSESTNHTGSVSHRYSDETDGVKIYRVKLTAIRDGDGECPTGRTKEVVLTAYPQARASFRFLNGTSFCTPMGTPDKPLVQIENQSANASKYVWTVSGAGVTPHTETHSVKKDKFELPELVNTTNASVEAKIKLQVEKTYNSEVCRDETEKSVRLLPKLEAKIIYTGDRIGCSPQEITMKHSSSNATNGIVWLIGGEVYGSADELKTTLFNNSGGVTPQQFRVALRASNGTCTHEDEFKLEVYPKVNNQMELSAVSGCAPLVLRASSTVNNPGYKYEWEFTGVNGPGLAAVANPDPQTFLNSSFTQAATGKVKLTTSIARPTEANKCKLVQERDITIYPKPNPRFDAPNPGCDPLKVSLDGQNTQVSTDGPAQYIWRLQGVESKSGQQSEFLLANPSHTEDKTYAIWLRVVSSNGCADSIQQTVDVYPRPQAKLVVHDSSDPTGKNQAACAPLIATIKNESVSLPNTTYEIDFGNGRVETETVPKSYTETFNNNSTDDKPYVITLKATNPKGCKDQEKATVTVFPGLNVDFTFSRTDERGQETGETEGCSPFDALFKSNARGAVEFYWDFGDNPPGVEIKPSGEEVRFHRYVNREVTDQEYTVKLRARNSRGCEAESSPKVVKVYATPVPQFTVSPYKQVWPNSKVNLVNTTDPMSSDWVFAWDYGDGNTSAGPSPTASPYEYQQFAPRAWDYAYKISLSAYNQQHPECKGTKTDFAYIMPPIPTPAFTSERTEACAPFQVVFQNKTPEKEFMEFEWDFGDKETSTERDPIHTYVDPGVYQVTLTARGEGGMSKAYGVYVAHGKPLVKFEMTPEQVMVPKARVKGQNWSTDWDGSPLRDGVKYLWDFGDGTTSEEVSPVKEYDLAGEFDITLRVESGLGCADELRVPKAVTVLPSGWIRFPNVFSPPLSGKNDGYYGDLSPEEYTTIFYPDYRGVSDYHLMIFDRWGSLVFETRDIKRGWDGTRNRKLLGGGCAMGVYAWRATGHYFNGTVFDKRGNVTLLR